MLGCLIGLMAFFLPRVVIAIMALTSDYIVKPFSGALLVPILGFIFMPYTLLAYCFAKNSHGSIDGWHLVLVVVAVLFDLGVVGGGMKFRRKK